MENTKIERANPFPKELDGEMGPGKDSYFDARIAAGERPKCRYPSNGIPKTKVQHADIETSFFWNEESA